MTDDYRTPRNTAAEPAIVRLAGLMGGADRYITEQEAQGQREVVQSDTFPAQAPWDELTALGFTAGDPVPGDPMFVRATLPQGWKREGSDHSMWSYVVDGRGVRRVAVFYKAAFYDRSAHAQLTAPGRSAAQDIVYGDGDVSLPAQWSVFTAAERADTRAVAVEYPALAEQHPDIYGEQAERATALLALIDAPLTAGEAPRG